jgi:hypothetical protein
MCVAAQPGQRWLVKPDSLIPKNGSIGLVTVWVGTAGSEAATNPAVKFSACNRTGADIAATKFCEMVAINGKLYVVPWEC